MPGFNGTGPLGLGPGTGRGLGPCGAGMGWRRGYGRWWARGFGRGFWGYQPRISEKEEKEMLEDKVVGLEEELKAVKERLSEIKKVK